MPRPDAGQQLAVARVAAAAAQVGRLDYLSWPELTRELTLHRTGRKDGPGWMPALIPPGPRRAERVQHLSALALDIEAATEKLPDGSKRVTGPFPPSLAEMAAELEQWGLAAALATSHSHQEPTADGGTLGPRYRATLKLSRQIKPDEVRPLALHVAARLGVADAVDKGCMEPARLYYLPRCPADRLSLAESLTLEGDPLDVDACLKQVRAAAKVEPRSDDPSASVIDAFNAAHDLPALLERHGYKPARGNRWLWPGSTTGMPGVVFNPDTGRVFSAHSSDPLHCATHARDTFDAWCVLEHGGDVRAAVKEAARILGMSGSTAAKDAGRAPQPLPPELLPIEAFPLDALPDAFRPWVQDVAERMHCPPDFVAVPLLVASASLVARHVGIRPQQRTDWTERANLWALIVGRPGFMKSPAMSQALACMDRLEARAAQEFKARAAEHEAESTAAKIRADLAVKAARDALKKDAGANVTAILTGEDDRDTPQRRRYVVNDLTYEALGEILKANPDGVLAVRDEIRGLFLHLAREEQAAARAFYLQAWSGGPYTFDRIQRGNVTVPDARLSIIGGIQPGPLSELVQQARRGAADDGMIERFLIAWPDSPEAWREVDRFPDSQGKRLAWETFERLDKLSAAGLGAQQDTDIHGELQGVPFLRFDDEAREAFAEWRRDFESTIRAAEAEGIEGALSKFRHHVPALAVALHVIDGGTGAVTLPATLRALALADYFESHARRLHGSGRRVMVRAARQILDKARAGALPDPFTARDVYRKDWAGLSDRTVVTDALEMLAVHCWLSETPTESGGRPTVLYSLTAGARHG